MVPTPIDQPPLFSWDEILSWDSVGWWFAVLVGLWGVLIGSGDYDIADIFFAVACSLLVIQWARVTSLRDASRRRMMPFLLGVILSISAVVVVVHWTSQKAVEAEQQKRELARLNMIPGLNTAIETLERDLRQGEEGRKTDAAYFKAKLEDSYKANDDLRQFAPALMKMAQTSEELTRKQYDQKVTNNKELSVFTEAVIKRLRQLESQHEAESRRQSDASQLKIAERFARLNASPTPEERLQLQEQVRADQRANMALYTSLRSQFEQIYRTSLMADAQYSKRELLSRVAGDSFLTPMERLKALAIDGILAGPTPLGDAADYLNALLRKLSP